MDLYRIRVGDYRVIYEIDDDAQLIVIIRVRHRRDVYQ
jgi:mRNA interferase RelE/StbE